MIGWFPSLSAFALVFSWHVSANQWETLADQISERLEAEISFDRVLFDIDLPDSVYTDEDLEHLNDRFSSGKFFGDDLNETTAAFLRFQLQELRIRNVVISTDYDYSLAGNLYLPHDWSLDRVLGVLQAAPVFEEIKPVPFKGAGLLAKAGVTLDCSGGLDYSDCVSLRHIMINSAERFYFQIENSAHRHLPDAITVMIIDGDTEWSAPRQTLFLDKRDILLIASGKSQVLKITAPSQVCELALFKGRLEEMD